MPGGIRERGDEEKIALGLALFVGIVAGADCLCAVVNDRKALALREFPAFRFLGLDGLRDAGGRVALQSMARGPKAIISIAVPSANCFLSMTISIPCQCCSIREYIPYYITLSTTIKKPSNINELASQPLRFKNGIPLKSLLKQNHVEKRNIHHAGRRRGHGQEHAGEASAGGARGRGHRRRRHARARRHRTGRAHPRDPRQPRFRATRAADRGAAAHRRAQRAYRPHDPPRAGAGAMGDL